MSDDGTAADAALFARLRSVWETVDPVPADLVDRMVAAVAVADLSREYEMLTLVETAGAGAVRGDRDTLTLQFSDGDVNVLVHVTAEEDGTRRVDGWTDGTALAVTLQQAGRDWDAPVSAGRFAFDGVRPGMSRLRVAMKTADGELRELQTPQFEV